MHIDVFNCVGFNMILVSYNPSRNVYDKISKLNRKYGTIKRTLKTLETLVYGSEFA